MTRDSSISGLCRLDQQFARDTLFALNLSLCESMNIMYIYLNIQE